MGRWTVRRRRGERGAAAVEFAIILPVLCLILFGIIDFGDMLAVRQSVSQAAAEGARAAAVNPGDADAKKAAAESAIKSALSAHKDECNDGCSVDVTDDCGDEDDASPNPSTCAKVKVEIDYHAPVPGFQVILPGTLSYTASARVN